MNANQNFGTPLTATSLNRNPAQPTRFNHLRPGLPEYQPKAPRGSNGLNRSHANPPRPSLDEFDLEYHQHRNAEREDIHNPGVDYFTVSPRVDLRQGPQQILVGSGSLDLNPRKMNAEGDIGVYFQYFHEKFLRLQREETMISTAHVPGLVTRYQGKIYLRPDHGSGLGSAECDEPIQTTADVNKALAFMQERGWIDAFVVSSERT
ncbi:hypothetical protein DL95DRAFT_408976 [Leptodontidium sp. 2 PMI_412]|nr:hypothetical protein DL95DRAFT_408976 [Leptodontidium sp. 2 PMI_412]